MMFGYPAGLEKKIAVTADTNKKKIDSLSKKNRTINKDVPEELQNPK